MAEVTLKSFLDNDSLVKAARKKLTAASAELNKQKSALVAAGTRISDEQRDLIQRRIDEAQKKYNDARSQAQEAETKQTQYYNLNQKNIQAKVTSQEISKAKQELEELLVQKQNQPNNAILDARIANANDRINQRGKFAPKQETKPVVQGQTPGDQQSAASVRDYLAEINSAAKVIRDMSPKDRQDLSSLLKNARFYRGPVSGIYTDDLVQAYQTALAQNQARSTQWGEEVPWTQFLQDKIIEASVTGGAGGPSITESRSISTPLEAASRVEDMFKSELGRMPTPEEVAKYSEKLIAREKKQSSSIRTVSKKVGGVTVTETTGGLDRNQFLQEAIRKMPEYSQRKAETRSLTMQTLQGTANANGVSLSPEQLEQYALEIQNGKDVKVVQSQIRNLAGLGMPDNVKKLLAEGTDLSTIYSPYKQAMATVLEINPSTISLSDPVLRGAISPNGEVSLYDYQRQLRKDPRWQYTNNARKEVADSALQVLRDFGFQG